MSRFLPSISGAKRQITNKLLREIFDHWNEVEEATGQTRGQMTLTYLFRSEPGNYARLIASLLPKDISIEHATADMDDAQLDDVIARIQERLIDARAREARPIPRAEPRAIASSARKSQGGEIEAAERKQVTVLQTSPQAGRIPRRGS
jgi:hypothetical protein